jgi:pimeloyl-ACP methyl ester carboxylesterase
MMRWRSLSVARAAKVLGILFCALLLGGAAYEQIGAWRDGRVLTQVGRSVDIGGRSLNISCLGDGSPTVIFDSGRTVPGYSWLPVQRGVAAFTRACWYDRASLGWSDPGPDPAWGDAAARDLHALLVNAGLKPPFVMVGHSFGGYVIRLYHQAYPGEVTGMVFADAAMEDAGTIPGMPHRDPPKVPRSVINALSIVLGHLGMIRFMTPDPGPPPDLWSAAEWDVLMRLRRQRNVLLADAHVGPESATSELVRAAGGLDDMPMIVLTQGRGPGGWIELQRRFAERSRRGRQIVVTGSGHAIPQYAPQTVIDAVTAIIQALGTHKD